MDLKRRTEDYNREKFDRENKENSLRNMEEELKRQATAHKESQLVIERLSRDNNGSLAFFPNMITAEINTVVQFQFHPKVRPTRPLTQPFLPLTRF